MAEKEKAAARVHIEPLSSSGGQHHDSDQQRRHLHRRLHVNTFFGRQNGGTINGARADGDANSLHSHAQQQHSNNNNNSKGLMHPVTELGLNHLAREHLRRWDKDKFAPTTRHSDSPASTGHASLPRRDSSERNRLRSGRFGTGDRTVMRRATVKAEDVKRVKIANTVRESELRISLRAVEELGMRGTRRLDDTFYGVLEKASVLRATVAAQQLLTDEVSRMQTQFNTETSSLVGDLSAQLDAFGGLEQQQRVVDDLAQQLELAREDTRKLNERLEAARLRIEGYEASETRRGARRRTHFTLTCATILAVLMLVATGFLFKHRHTVGQQLDVVGQRIVQGAVDIVEDVIIAPEPRSSPREDPYLSRLFDEL